MLEDKILYIGIKLNDLMFHLNKKIEREWKNNDNNRRSWRHGGKEIRNKSAEINEI